MSTPISQRVCILGTGSYLPEQVVTNRDLEKIVETSDEWITTRTGIKERRRAARAKPRQIWLRRPPPVRWPMPA